MPVLGEKLFIGRDKVLETDISNCEVQNVGDAVNNVLRDYGWEGGPVCGVILHLSPDSERISTVLSVFSFLHPPFNSLTLVPCSLVVM